MRGKGRNNERNKAAKPRPNQGSIRQKLIKEKGKETNLDETQDSR